jgi:hypothetical protein
MAQDSPITEFVSTKVSRMPAKFRPTTSAPIRPAAISTTARPKPANATIVLHRARPCSSPLVMHTSWALPCPDVPGGFPGIARRPPG